MKLFKKLCSQNQQHKFNALWARLDELTLKQTAEAAPNGDEPIALGPLPTDTPQIVRRSGSSIRSFSQWIRNEPNEKWALLYDSGGARYGVMTTNLAEVYNWVMRGMRSLPLVGIVEGILHGTCKYFIDRFAAAKVVMEDNRMLYGRMLCEYMEKANRKAHMHRANQEGTAEHRFSVLCRDKGRRGVDVSGMFKSVC